MTTTQLKTDRHTCSRRAFEQARHLMPGGVNSPVRAYKAVGREPITICRGAGARVTDIDGNEFLDYVCSYGPLILGHAPVQVTAALRDAAALGTSFGMPTEAESTLARMVVEAVESIDLIRFVNSGTEAVMSVIRLARAATGKPSVIKCAGCYHGHSDALLVEAGSGALTLGVPSSPGVLKQTTAHTLIARFNDLQDIERLLATHDEVACIVIEPIAGNMGCIPPRHGYLEGLRRLCDQHGVLLIFDEVMTGFRVAYGGAQQLYGVRPDLTCLGKIIGGGLPCAAYGGREDLMRLMAPDGEVYQAGTLSGNPLAMAAGIATLEALRDGSAAYDQLEEISARLAEGLQSAAACAGVPVRVARVGSMVCCFFARGPVEDYGQATGCDTDSFGVFFGAMLDRGVILPPSQFETWFVSTAHDHLAIDETLVAAVEAFKVVASGREPVR